MLRGECINGRWSGLVREALPDGEIVASVGTDDYQGSVAIVAKLDDGRWLHYSWSYGSCSHCDSWEEQDKDIVKQEIRKGAAILDRDAFLRYIVSAADSDAGWLAALRGKEDWMYEEKVGLDYNGLLDKVVGG